jgi:hypothetical protein
MALKVDARIKGYGPHPARTQALVTVIVEFQGPQETMERRRRYCPQASHGAGERLCAPVPRFSERKSRLAMTTIIE